MQTIFLIFVPKTEIVGSSYGLSVFICLEQGLPCTAFLSPELRELRSKYL